MARVPDIGTQSAAAVAKPKKLPYTADQVAASLAANPQAAGAAGSFFAGGAETATPNLPATQTAPNPFETNPGYLAALAAEQTGSQQSDAALRAAQEAAIVGYGDPSLAAALGFDVSPNTSAAARQNYLAGNSSLYRLDKQKGLSEQGNVNNLAAHGILFSGELGYQQRQIGQRYGNAVYDTQQQLLSGLNSAGQQNVATKQGLHAATTGALSHAYDLAIQHPESSTGVGTPPPPGAGPSDVAPYDRMLTSALARAPSSRLAKPPLRNPYTTGQKRFG